MSEFEKYRATLTTVNLLMSANCCRHAFDYQQSEIDQLKAKNKSLVHAVVNANAETKKWAHNYWDGVERNAEYGAMLLSNPDSLEFSCFKKEKEIEKLKAEKAGLEKRLKAVDEIMNDYYTGSFEDAPELAGWISTALRGEHD